MNDIVNVNQLSIANRLFIDQWSVQQGECWHILGQNGAGKTSLLTSLAGLQSDVLASVVLWSIPLTQWKLAQLANVRCYASQLQSVTFPLTGRELLSFYCDSNHVPDTLNNALQITPFIDQPMTSLSGGERQRLHITRNLLQVWPRIKRGQALLLLDEPLQHLDIAHQLSVLTLLTALAEMGNTIIVTSHDVNHSFHHASHTLLLRAGNIVASGRVKEVMTVSHLSQTLNCHFHLSYTENAYEYFIPKVNSDETM